MSIPSDTGEQLSQLQAQNALLVKILRALLAGNLGGNPSSAEWQLAALDPAGGPVRVAPFEFGA